MTFFANADEVWEKLRIEIQKAEAQYETLLTKELERAEASGIPSPYSKCRTRLEFLDESDRLFPANLQPCRCDENKDRVASSLDDYIKCRRHLSRYFPNYGCFWCCNTDCSKWQC